MLTLATGIVFLTKKDELQLMTLQTQFTIKSGSTEADCSVR